MNSNVQRSSRRLTPEEVSRLRQMREQVDAEKDDIIDQARQAFAAHEQSIADTIHELKSLRESRGMTIAEVANRLGTVEADIQQLESKQSNPTFAELIKYAEAIGKRLVVSFEDAA